ncbi:MAG: hypothetical protein ABRQ34_08900, partial [Smithellaceae bacterium]
LSPRLDKATPPPMAPVMVKKPLLVICIKSPPDTYVKNDLCQKRHKLTDIPRKVNMLYKA